MAKAKLEDYCRKMGIKAGGDRKSKNQNAAGGNLKAKEKCKHGEFGALFGGANLNPKEAQEFKFAFNQYMAARYMKVAKYPNQAKLLAAAGTPYAKYFMAHKWQETEEKNGQKSASA